MSTAYKSDGTAKLLKRIDRLGNCCLRLEKQFKSGRLRVTDVELVYSSSFLSIWSYWAAFLEDCLYDSACGPASPRKKKLRLVELSSRDALKKILLYPNKRYVGIDSLEDAEAIASLFIRDGKPFAAVSSPYRTLLQQAAWIRNAIAHQSDFAVKIFRDKVPGVSSLPIGRRTPGAFLRHEFRTSPTQRRYEIYSSAIKAAATEVQGAWA